MSFPCISALCCSLFITSCVNTPTQPSIKTSEFGKSKSPWVKSLQSEVAALGAKNWIVVSERAYPTPKQSGVHVLVADAPMPEVLGEVFDAIESEGHIWPKIYTLREFEHLQEDYAPGVGMVRKARNVVLGERKSQEISKTVAERMFNNSMKDYRVLLIKSNSAYPYSSIFMELDSGYWNGNSEEALRKVMIDE